MMKPIPVQLQFFHVVQVVEQHARAGEGVLKRSNLKM